MDYRCPLHGTDLRFHVRHHGRPRTATAGWQKITTFIIQYEITLILIVTLFGHWLPDLAASALVSLIAAAQLQEFRRLKGGPFTSLMMTGNLRTAAQSLYDGFIRGQQKGRKDAATIGTIILSFATGAAVTGILTTLIGTYALVGAALCLVWIDIIFWRDQVELH